jgi:hypothetical protein
MTFWLKVMSLAVVFGSRQAKASARKVFQVISEMLSSLIASVNLSAARGGSLKYLMASDTVLGLVVLGIGVFFFGRVNEFRHLFANRRFENVVEGNLDLVDGIKVPTNIIRLIVPAPADVTLSSLQVVVKNGVKPGFFERFVIRYEGQ